MDMFLGSMLWTLSTFALVFTVIQIIRLLFADCDLTLQWLSRVGRGIGHLRGKVVWITGASSGIGEYLAYELAAAGCKLILSARRKDKLEKVKHQCLMVGPLKESDIMVIPLDLLKYDTHKSAVQTALKHFHGIDILVNNAGRSQRALWEETDLQVDIDMLNINVVGVLSLTKAVLPHMIETHGGHIVIMNSVAGKIGAPMSGSYSGSKFALMGWFDTLRCEGFRKGIKVTTICPGPVFSDILENAMTAQPGELHGVKMKETEKRISTRRCAYLSAVAIANQLDEVWIALQPILLFVYASQYMPAFARRIAKRMGMKQMERLREGQ